MNEHYSISYDSSLMKHHLKKTDGTILFSHHNKDEVEFQFMHNLTGLNNYGDIKGYGNYSISYSMDGESKIIGLKLNTQYEKLNKFYDAEMIKNLVQNPLIKSESINDTLVELKANKNYSSLKEFDTTFKVVRTDNNGTFDISYEDKNEAEQEYTSMINHQVFKKINPKNVDAEYKNILDEDFKLKDMDILIKYSQEFNSYGFSFSAINSEENKAYGRTPCAYADDDYVVAVIDGMTDEIKDCCSNKYLENSVLADDYIKRLITMSYSETIQDLAGWDNISSFSDETIKTNTLARFGQYNMEVGAEKFDMYYSEIVENDLKFINDYNDSNQPKEAATRSLG